MAHPVLEQQQVMDGGFASASASPPTSESLQMSQVAGEWGNKAVPNLLAAMVLGSVVTLVVLRAAGFRFSFGVNVGGGS